MPHTLARRMYLTALSTLIVTIFMLPLVSFSGYSILRNTTSELGAQESPFAWVMCCVFVAMGVAILYMFRHVLRRHQFAKLCIWIFGISFILVGVFQHEAGTPSANSGNLEATLHSFFASGMGFAITVFALLISRIVTTSKARVAAMTAAGLSLGLSGAMVALPEYAGLLQRVMFLTILLWLYFVAVHLEQLKQ